MSRGEYAYANAELNASHHYLLPAVKGIVGKADGGKEATRIFDLGCGNGSVAHEFQKLGFHVVGVDASVSAIREANQRYPSLRLEIGSVYDDLANTYGTFPIVLSLEVVEHLYFPRKFATTLFRLVEPGGMAVVSTPYHGYWKNLVLALSGRMDRHFTALWDHGHIKFWSVHTLRTLLEEAGFHVVKFLRVGRVPLLAKSMIVVARKPHE